ncbi:MAG: hypothetical protein SFU98_02050 [Leptospiraceae bacterium]|nr:hypothetical protein [Leptospiraceae bacterium]
MKMLFLLFLFCTSNIHSEEFTNYSFKKYNFQVQIPYFWRWEKANPEKREGLLLKSFSPDLKNEFTVKVAPTRSMNTVRSFYKYVRKSNIATNEEPHTVDETYLNLKLLNGYMSSVTEIVNSRPKKGFLFTATDGVWMFTGKVLTEENEFEKNLSSMKRILQGFESSLKLQQYCCARCLEKKRSEEKTSLVCSELVSETQCNQFLKNTKLRISECEL